MAKDDPFAAYPQFVGDVPGVEKPTMYFRFNDGALEQLWLNGVEHEWRAVPHVGKPA